MDAFKAPNSKHQHPKKRQTSTSKTLIARSVWSFEYWNFSGAWRLELGAWSFQLAVAKIEKTCNRNASWSVITYETRAMKSTREIKTNKQQ
jgi:hypothetical protein